MRNNIIQMELRLGRRGWMIGGAVIILFQFMFAALADTYLNNADMIKMINSMPSAMLESFGIDATMMTSFEGWMGGEPFTFFILLLGSFAAIWSSGSIAKERDQQTGEFLFTLPYSRSEIFFSKAAAQWMQLTSIYILTAAVVWLGGTAFSTVTSLKALMLLYIAGYLVALAFAGIGFMLTVFLASERAALSIGIGLVIVMFLLNMLSTLSPDIRWLAKFSLFHVFNSKRIVHLHALTALSILITLGIYAAGLLMARTILKRQDL